MCRVSSQRSPALWSQPILVLLGDPRGLHTKHLTKFSSLATLTPRDPEPNPTQVDAPESDKGTGHVLVTCLRQGRSYDGIQVREFGGTSDSKNFRVPRQTIVWSMRLYLRSLHPVSRFPWHSRRGRTGYSGPSPAAKPFQSALSEADQCRKTSPARTVASTHQSPLWRRQQ